MVGDPRRRCRSRRRASGGSCSVISRPMCSSAWWRPSNRTSGSVSSVRDVVADLRRPQLAALVARADREPAGRSSGGPRRPPATSADHLGVGVEAVASRPGTRRGGASPARRRSAGDEERRGSSGRSDEAAHGSMHGDEHAAGSLASADRSRRSRRVGPPPGDASAAPRPALDWRQRHPTAPARPSAAGALQREPCDDRRADQDHLRDPARRQRGAPRRSTRRASRRRRAGSGASHRNFVDGRGARRRRDVRGPLADRHATSSSGRSRSGTRAGRPGRDRGRPRARSRRGSALGWERRLEILKRAAELISERQMEYAGLMAIEVGKTRLEALGEVEEAADLIRYYAKTAEDNAFYDHPMDNLGDAAVHTRSILRPHGVFAVISPFNFPMALAVGPSAAAMMAGNTVVFKPASASRDDRGRDRSRPTATRACPDGVFNLVMGPGDTVGDELQQNPGIDGIVFTGSYEVGLRAVPDLLEPATRGRASSRWAARTRRSCLRTADLEEAAEGIMRVARSGSAARSARRTAGSTSSSPSTTSSSGCSSRRPRSSTVGDPLPRTAFLGPGHRPAGGRPPPAGGRRGAPRRHGVHRRRAPHRRGPRRAASTSSRRSSAACRRDHRLFQDELFAPFTAVHAVDSLDEALAPRQRQRLRPDRGRVLARTRPRSSGSSTRSRPASCTSTGGPARRPARGRASRRSAAGRARARPGKSGLSMYYVAQFLREQSHTVVD